MSLKEALACIKSHKNFLITTHINSEGDALGSELALYRILKTLGKRATIINDDTLPYGYDFLPEIKNINKFRKGMKDKGFDCLAILDCSDITRCGEVHKIVAKNKTVLNIDHHISNQGFGDINWVESGSSSCTQMIYKLYKRLGIALDKDAALLLYVGIITDTGNLRYPNTTAFTHKVVAELLKYNLNISQIYKNIYENIPFEDMRLLSRILPSMRRQFQGKVIWFKIKRNLLKDKKTSFDLTESILNFARSVKDAEVAVLFKENLGEKFRVRVNLRSRGRVDVNKIAAFFGGGGHKTASGATVKGRIDEVRRKVLAKIRENLF